MPGGALHAFAYSSHPQTMLRLESPTPTIIYKGGPWCSGSLLAGPGPVGWKAMAGGLILGHARPGPRDLIIGPEL